MSEHLDEVDVVVVGSGAGGLAAAVAARKLGLEVLVVEKESCYGGTTARSGGVLWIPNNPISTFRPQPDSMEDARTYLRHECGAHYDAARVEAFLTGGPRMVDFFTRQTDVQLIPLPEYPDYHAESPGGRTAGRSIMAAPMDGRELGDRIRQLRPPLREITFVGMMFNSSAEISHFFNVTRSLRSAAYVARRLLTHAKEMLVHGRAMRLTNGNALAARLAKSAFALGIPLWLQSPVVGLLRDGERVSGVMVGRRDGQQVPVRARRGVVLAAGGFPQDVARRAELFPHAPTGREHHSPAPPGNTGDGLRLAESVGGRVARELPNAGAWIPVSRVSYRDGITGVFPHLIDRYKPGVIAVNRRGQRFVNESDSYHDVGVQMQKACAEKAEVEAWLIADHRTVRRYGLGFAKPFPLPLGPHLRSSYLLRGATLAELAAKAGIDAAQLQQTVDTYNAGAVDGKDLQFRRGWRVYNRFLGDRTHQPNPCVAPVAQGPFYAVKIVMGDLGTFAGIRTDAHARVLDGQGRPIEGLFAAGNDNASVMGGGYPGGGITLGPAMTFGFIAAEFMAGRACAPTAAQGESAVLSPS
ncbi:FAD-dependent oxidoreductase [Variovorax soli]|uniref:Succinate dehydrogenase/fumarate reductase flavoprotein subunit n=1 Tax=Variovorax soli TaxID=376815 RepID=A0ABU1N9F2_9BURK|nr:FAD-dependent oxidoreductase [Variovorax soli]MDR6535070.1 succinate dehydrogenase/fumarate reductase flavoprotein subunit [Variovorax soli]